MGGHGGGPGGDQSGDGESGGETGRGHGGGHSGRPGGGHGGWSGGDQSSDGEMPTRPDMGSTDGEMPTPPEMESTDGEMPTPPDMGSTEGGQMPSDLNSGQDNAQTAEKAADSESCIKISGGTITIINETGNDADGLDSNGDMGGGGGTIYISLVGTGSNSAVDYASESGGVAEISGGTIIACGASSMAESFDTSSTQASILYNTGTTAEAGTTLAIKDSDGNVLLSWEVPCSFSSALISCPEMQVGGTYTVVVGGSTEEITLDEVSASYGDGQSGMHGGDMNQGGKAGDESQMPPDMGQSGETGGGGQMPPDMSQSGETGGGGQMPPDMSQSGETGGGDQMPPDMGQSGETGGDEGQMPSDESNEGMTGKPSMQKQGQQEQSQAEEDLAAQDTVTAQPVDAKSWAVIGGSTALLVGAAVIVLLYKRP